VVQHAAPWNSVLLFRGCFVEVVTGVESKSKQKVQTQKEQSSKTENIELLERKIL